MSSVLQDNILSLLYICTSWEVRGFEYEGVKSLREPGMLASQEPLSQYFQSNLKCMVPEIAEKNLLLRNC